MLKNLQLITSIVCLVNINRFRLDFFSRLNLFLHELNGVEPIVSVARTYPDNSSAHILGYVSQISTKDLKTKKYLKDLVKKTLDISIKEGKLYTHDRLN